MRSLELYKQLQYRWQKLCRAIPLIWQALGHFMAALQSREVPRWPLITRTTLVVSATAIASMVVLVGSIVLLPKLEDAAPQAGPGELTTASSKASDAPAAVASVAPRVLQLPDPTQAAPKTSLVGDPTLATLRASEPQQPAKQPAPVQTALRILTPTPSTIAASSTTAAPSGAADASDSYVLPQLLAMPPPVAISSVSAADQPAEVVARKRAILPLLPSTSQQAPQTAPATVTQLKLAAIPNRAKEATVQSQPQAASPEAPLALDDAPLKEVASLKTRASKAAVSEDLQADDALLKELASPKVYTLKETVARGDSLSLLFRKFDLSQYDLALMMQTSKENKRRLSRLSPGQRLEMEVNDAHRLEKFVLHLSVREALHLTRSGDRFAAEIIKQPLKWRDASANGVIDSSLYEAAQQAGVSAVLTEQVIDILGWDIDFSRDVRSGDRFKLIYAEPYVKQQRVGGGHILALEFVNRGKVIRAVRYTFTDGRSQYFTPEGLSMRKAFLRSPVQFSRISSRFNLKRFHPVLHKVRAHRGVDYAAARGTLVKATADGRIVFVGRNGGYGRTIKIQHGASYTTLYAHLRRYKKGVRSGARVRQGDPIGYVGKSGLATGYHLHYEFRVNGVHKDPLRFNFPKGEAIGETSKVRFATETRGLIERLGKMPHDARFAALNQ